MARDYPDYMDGFDTLEGARRDAAGVLVGRTGKLLFASSFEVGLSELALTGGASATVRRTALRCYSGLCSLELTTGALTNRQAGIEKYISPVDITRYGVEFFGMSNFPVGLGYQELQIEITGRLHGASNNLIHNHIAIRTDSSNDGKVLASNSAGAFVDTGYRLPSFFQLGSLPYHTSNWHSIKFVADVKGTGSLLRHLTVNGQAYSLADYASVISDVTVYQPYLLVAVTLKTLEDDVNTFYVDKLLVTSEDV